MTSFPEAQAFPNQDDLSTELLSADIIDFPGHRDEQDVATDLADTDTDQTGGDGEESSLVHLYFEDWQKVEAARQSESLFENLIHEYTSFIRIIASNYFLNGGTSDDLLQEGFFGFYKAVRDYDGVSSSFREFAALCMRRQIITAVKTANREKHQILNRYVSFSHRPAGQDADSDVTLGDALPDPGRLPEDIVAGMETFNGLVDLLSSDLSYLEYSVLKMYIEGESYEIMAEELDTDTKTIDNAFQRVKRKVLQFLEESES